MEVGLSIIIPSLNPGSAIERCLMAIDREVKGIDQPYEILVVDSSPHPIHLKEVRNLKLCHSEVRLFAAEARNLGARMARYPLLVFFDSDVVILPEALQNLIDGLQEKYDVVGGVYEIHNPHTSRISTFQDLFLLFRYKTIPLGGTFFSSGHFALSKDNFWKVGGFSENLQSYEDVDLSYRFKKSFLKVHISFESRGYHLKNFNLKSLFKDYYIKVRNMVFYRLQRLNDVHWCDTFLPSTMRINYYLISLYTFLFAMITVPDGPITFSFGLSMLGLLLILDIGLLVPFMIYVWRETHRYLWVVGALIFFKATTIPTVFGAIVGFYKFLRNDDSFLKKEKAVPNITKDITHCPEAR